MLGCLKHRLAWTLALAVACGAAPARGQEPSWSPGAAGPASGLAMADAPPGSWQPFAAADFTARETDLSRRLANLEASLQKIEDKAKQDKKSASTKPTIQVIGRAYADSALFKQDAQSQAVFGDAKDTTYFRSIRLGAQGEAFEVMSYKMEMDFAVRDPQDLSLIAARDVYLQVKELPVLQHIRVGHFKEPLSLDQMISSRFITFMERSLPDTFIPGFNTGASTFGYTENERVTWAIGVFAAGQDTPPYVAEDATLANDGTAGTARITWTPWYDEATDGRRLLHLGMGCRYCDLTASTQRIRTRAEVGVGPCVVDTRIGPLDTLDHVHSAWTAVPEIALVYGPFSMQAEYFLHGYNRDTGYSDPTFHGGYVLSSFFLTGECRAYNRREGRFERIKPFENFFRVRDQAGAIYTGRGAWELTYRYSWIDLDQGGIAGGAASDHTFGVNWYLTPYARLMLNYIHSNDSPNAHRDDAELDVVALRAQLDF